MSRRRIIKQLKEKNSNLNHQEIENLIDIFSKSISDYLKKGNSVEIRGLGHWFSKKLKENYNARNPATNELIYKPERYKVRFRTSKKLKKLINE